MCMSVYVYVYENVCVYVYTYMCESVCRYTCHPIHVEVIEC